MAKTPNDLRQLNVGPVSSRRSARIHPEEDQPGRNRSGLVEAIAIGIRPILSFSADEPRPPTLSKANHVEQTGALRWFA